MVRKIRFTKRADKRFDEIITYLQDRFGQSTTVNFIERTYSFFDIIVEHPQIGRIQDKQKGIYGFVLEKPMTIYYRFTNKEVVILNFFDNRTNPKKRGK